MQNSQEQLLSEGNGHIHELNDLKSIERAIRNLHQQSGDPQGLGYTEGVTLLSKSWLNFVEHASDILSRDTNESSRITELIQKMLAGNLNDEEIRELISLKMRFEEIYREKNI